MHLLPLPDAAPRRLLLAFSGGRDSTALLHRLATRAGAPWQGLRAVHIDHGLHPDSARWAEACVAFGAALGVPVAVERVAVRQTGGGVEAAAREARWAALASARQDDECLVLAHHRDDQAETLLLALLRGSGERGLAGMQAFRVDARGPIWRPLLATPREAITDYARAHGLRWIDDPSNHDQALSRNALRHAVLPLLRQRWPQADAALARSAEHLAEADALLEAQARRDLAPLLGLDAAVLDAVGLRALHAREPARARRALRYWVGIHGGALSRDALERVFGDWAAAPPGRTLTHALGAHRLRQWGNRLWLSFNAPAASAAELGAAPEPWSGRAPLRLPDGSLLRLLGAEAFDAPLFLSTRHDLRHGLRPRMGQRGQSAQAMFAQVGVPPWQRPGVPLLANAEGRLMALGDLAYDHLLDDWLAARGARLLWQPAPVDG